ncbi:MAG: helix-turn-helix domain-containing protein [Candidatus Diapherotrites archaeon]|nr:helix-turn-helix domain-containing protein [Candidatus Diapherotrites archaeon]
MNIKDKLVATLEKAGFACFAPLERKSCFDLAAKKGATLLLFKVLSNIDSIRESQAKELKAISASLCATPLIVGEKTKVRELEDGVVYERYGIKAITVGTLSNYFLDNIAPEKRFFKGKVVAEIKPHVLQERMRELNISISQLAHLLGVSRETIYNYQRGEMNIEFQKAKHIESVLDTNVIKNIDLLTTPASCESEELPPYLKKMQDIGFEVVPVYRGFDAIAKEKEALLVDKTTSRYARMKADFMKKTGSFFETHPIYILEKVQVPDNIKGVSVIRQKELDESESADEIIDLVKKREKKG